MKFLSLFSYIIIFSYLSLSYAFSIPSDKEIPNLSKNDQKKTQERIYNFQNKNLSNILNKNTIKYQTRNKTEFIYLENYKNNFRKFHKNRKIREINNKQIKNDFNHSDENDVGSVKLDDFLMSDFWANSNNVTLYGLLNLNKRTADENEESRPKYEITFRILPGMNKIYRDIESDYKKPHDDDLVINTISSSPHISSDLSNRSNRIESAMHLFTNTSDANVENETIEYLIERFKNLYPVERWRKHGWFTDDYLYIINQHWLKFPPQSRNAHYILAFIYLFVLAAGIFGNLLVIFMFFRCRSLRTPANILVVNLAFSDLLMMTELPMLVYNSVFEGPALGQLACTIYGFIGGLTGTVSIGTLTAIAFDRYSVVVYPLDPLRAITGLRAKLSVVITWAYGIFFSLIPALDIGLGRYVPEGYLTSCSFDYLSDNEDAKIFIFVFFIAAWVLPLVIITFCYAKIIHVVIVTRNIGKQATDKMSSRHCKEQEKRKTELKLAGVVICVIGLFFAAWTPYAIVSLLGIFDFRHLVQPIYSMIPAVCAKLASCLDPFVYIVTHPKFRQECENLFQSKSQQHRKSTMRQGWSENQQNQSAKSIAKDNREFTSENEVEVVEMVKVKSTKNTECSVSDSDQSISKRGIGYSSVSPIKNSMKTVSSHTLTKGIDASELPKSLEENEALKPPSWYVKPEFTRTNSVKNVVKKIQRLTSSDSSMSFTT